MANKTKKEEKVTLTKEQILNLVKKPNKEKEPYSIKLKEDRPRNVTKEEFDRYVRQCGSSGHVGVSKAWVGKYVHFTIEEVKD